MDCCNNTITDNGNVKQRYAWADSLKGWLMFAVIIGHVTQEVLGEACFNNHMWNYIYSFHMPAFMAVSGWLAYKPHEKSIQYGKAVFRRFQQLLIPYFVWSVLSFVLSKDFSVNHFIEIIVDPSHYFWFLWILFWIYVLFSFIKYISSRIHFNENLLLFFVCFIFVVVMVLFDLSSFGFQLLSYYFIFFAVGYWIHKCFIIPICGDFLGVVLCFIWLVLGWFWNMKYPIAILDGIPFISSTIFGYLYRGITAIVAIAFLFYAAPKFLNGIGFVNRIAIETGKVSLGVYILHLFYLGITVSSIKNILVDANDIVVIIIASILLYFLSIATVWLIQRCKWMNRILLGKF